MIPVCPTFQVVYQLISFHEIQYEGYLIRGHTLARFNFLK